MSKVFKNSRLRKLLSYKKKKKGGRNFTGKITVKNRGGGNFNCLLKIDFIKFFSNLECIFLEKIYFYKNVFVGLFLYSNGVFFFNTLPNNLQKGDSVYNGIFSSFSIGNSLPLCSMPVGSTVFNLELNPGKGAKFLRAIGGFGVILNKFKNFGNKILLRLKSGEEYLVDCNCFATFGVVYKTFNNYLYKAGCNRWLGKKPHVRGVAMNPVDHPHGGNTSGGRCSVSPYGKLTKGKLTRSKKINKKIIFNRRKLRNV